MYVCLPLLGPACRTGLRLGRGADGSSRGSRGRGHSEECEAGNTETHTFHLIERKKGMEKEFEGILF